MLLLGGDGLVQTCTNGLNFIYQVMVHEEDNKWGEVLGG